MNEFAKLMESTRELRVQLAWEKATPKRFEDFVLECVVQDYEVRRSWADRSKPITFKTIFDDWRAEFSIEFAFRYHRSWRKAEADAAAQTSTADAETLRRELLAIQALK